MIESSGESGAHENIIFEEDTEKDKPSFQTGAHHPIEFVEDTTSRFGGSNQGSVEEEDTLPNSFVPPITPKEDEPEMPLAPEVPKVNAPKESSEIPPVPKTDNEKPKVTKQILPNSPEVKQSKVKNEHSLKTTVVGESPKFKRFNAVQISDSNKMIETRKDVKLKQKALPNTGESFNKNPVLLGGLMSLFGLILLRRSKKVSK
ncbi:LPXTG cell wall anchor domain-containing protein [Staphylococcus chromogenes]|nr:LPXTG cell wall anchor domain-containing protein [Staphylococcus chromogenes]